jgi:hypothetical protein
MNINLVIEGELLDNLTRIVELHNSSQRALNADWVDVTPEAYWLDWNTRWLEGLREPVLTLEQQKTKIAEAAASVKDKVPALRRVKI